MEFIQHACCPGKHVALIFEKTSTRTRCAFEVAARDLGMGVTYLDPSGWFSAALLMALVFGLLAAMASESAVLFS